MCSISQKRLITLHGVHKLDNFMPKSRQKNSLIRQVGWYSGLKWITCHIQALLCSIRFTRSFFMTKLRLVALQFWSTKHGLFSLSLSKTMWSTHYHLRHVGPFPIFSLKSCVPHTIIYIQCITNQFGHQKSIQKNVCEYQMPRQWTLQKSYIRILSYIVFTIMK